MRKRKLIRQHWYRIYRGECPVCGADKSFRERVYGRKPRPLASRHIYLSDRETYDHCLG